jgi:hypothetical protein
MIFFFRSYGGGTSSKQLFTILTCVVGSSHQRMKGDDTAHGLTMFLGADWVLIEAIEARADAKGRNGIEIDGG